MRWLPFTLVLIGALMFASSALSQEVSSNRAADGISKQPASLPCNGPSGVPFNLEPRANAVPQNQANADFLLDRVAPNDDLIVQAANDWRGNLKNAKWGQSVSGYYVHRSATADCSVQFEGGLPPTTSQGVVYTGVGNPIIAADPARDAFFIADTRFGSNANVAIGLFRASASTLLNPATCPNGSHSAAQAATCWAATPPALLLIAALGDEPQVAVDERPSGAGKGAGDVYVLAQGADPNSSNTLLLVACTNALACGPLVSLNNSQIALGFNSMHVRSDGTVTISFANPNADGSQDILWTTCTPSGAPKPPLCASPTLVRHLVAPLSPSINVSVPSLVNISLPIFTYPKQASRAEAGGKFTSFLVYDDCKSPSQYDNPPVRVCLQAEIMMVFSSDDGKTWSSPVSVDTARGHHFFPAISTDASTGIVHIAFYSAEGDSFNHEVQVFRSQIKPGGVSLSTPQPVTTLLNAIDLTPGNLGILQFDNFLAVVARGNGISGQSHLYASFDSTVVRGTYNGRPLPELNNHISRISY